MKKQTYGEIQEESKESQNDKTKKILPYNYFFNRVLQASA
jgi:Na+-translocating ferredoxin:NAD+ oxidoreductase RnfG subunit